MNNVTEQIKERINIVDLVGEYLKLEKAGSNYKALCPFHNEKTPSFMVNPERNFWYCFGCQKGGDIFTFIQEMEGLEFREALEKLAEKAGVEIPKFQSIPKKEKSLKKNILEILEFSARYFSDRLDTDPQGKKIKEYLFKRKITSEQIDNFQIGYASEGWTKLLDCLLEKGYSLFDISKSGVLVHKDGQPTNLRTSYYDRFRNRIMFPVFDFSGNVIGFSARVSPGGDEKTAKYINTPQSLVYDKSQTLFGLYQAKTEIKKKDFVIIVEGNLDVVASFSSQINNAVAVSGTALTDKQISALKRYTNNFKFCFDMDQAGQQATKKSIQSCLMKEVDVEIILLPKGFKDVNDLVIKDPSLWEKAVKEAVPVMEYFFTNIFSKYRKEDPKGKKMIAYELLNIISKLSDPIEKNYWLKKLSDKLGVEEGILTQVLERVRLKEKALNNGNDSEFEAEKQVTVTTKPRVAVLQEKIIGLFNLFSKELSEEITNFPTQLFDQPYNKIFQALLDGSKKNFLSEINQYEISVKYSYDGKEGFMENKIEPFYEYQVLKKELEKERAKALLKKIASDIKIAEEEKDEEALRILMGEFSKISREIEEPL
jgi:DNA primase